MKKSIFSLIALVMVFSMVLGACTPTEVIREVEVTKQVEVVKEVVKEVEKEVQVEVQVTVAAPVPAKTFVTWFQYDEGNVDPQSDEKVGNEWLRQTMPQFNKAFEGKWTWDNQFTPWDRMASKLVAAVMAGAEVPDVMEVSDGNLNLYYQNGTLQDITDWAKAQSWYGELDASAIAMCTGPDGKLYCVPMVLRPSVVYVWKDRFPNGFPNTMDEWLVEGERLKGEGNYAMTFFGSTAFDGNGAGRAVYLVVSSFGGSYDDGNGKLALNTPENVAAIAWLREMVQKGYVPEIAFAGGFQEEQAFMDNSAGAFPTGLFGYRYLNPLTAPNGTQYDKKNENDMFDALAAGDIYLAPMPAGPGGIHGCGASSAGLGIPVGAQNVEAAYDFINWLLTPEQNPAYVLGPGAGFPVIKSTQATEQFQAPLYTQAAEAVSVSTCAPPYPTITDTTAASRLIMGAVYKLIKTDPTADIATELQKAQDEFNQGH
jgi:multiple sugar transport system substrate-binding protein